MSGHDSTGNLLPATLEDRIRDLRPGLEKKLSGEGTNAPSRGALLDVLAGLLAYAWSVESVLSAVKKRETIPGHALSVRSYVEQVFSGDAPKVKLDRLNDYFRDSIKLLAANAHSVQKALDQFAQQIAEKLKPSRIEEQARVSTLLGLLGLKEIAFWREYLQQYRSLDPDALLQIAKDQNSRGG